MNPEKIGRRLESIPLGGVKWAVTLWVWPGRTVNEVWLNRTVAVWLRKGTGWSSKKVVPGWRVWRVPAGMWVTLNDLEVLPMFLTVKVCLYAV